MLCNIKSSILLTIRRKNSLTTSIATCTHFSSSNQLYEKCVYSLFRNLHSEVPIIKATGLYDPPVISIGMKNGFKVTSM